MSTIDEVIAKYKKVAEEIEKDNKPLAIAVRSVMALQARRIFTEGKNSDGTQIGNYNTTEELYVDMNKQFKKQSTQGMGKYGETQFKNGNKHKTKFFASYKTFREFMGRQTNFVDLKFSNELQLDFSNAREGNPPEPTKVSPNIYRIQLNKAINVDKAGGLQKKFGTIFSLTKAERDIFIKIFNLEVNKIFGNA